MTTEELYRPTLSADEIALTPKWSLSKDLIRYLGKVKAAWRFDPLFHFVAIKDQALAARLRAEFHCTIVTDELRNLIARKTGARIIGCERFDAMVMYSFEDNRLYRVDAMSFAVSPVQDAKKLLCFRGLGKPAASAIKYDFDSTAEAIEAFRTYIIGEQRAWLGKHGVSVRQKTGTRGVRGKRTVVSK